MVAQIPGRAGRKQSSGERKRRGDRMYDRYLCDHAWVVDRVDRTGEEQDEQGRRAQERDRAPAQGRPREQSPARGGWDHDR